MLILSLEWSFVSFLVDHGVALFMQFWYQKPCCCESLIEVPRRASISVMVVLYRLFGTQNWLIDLLWCCLLPRPEFAGVSRCSSMWWSHYVLRWAHKRSKTGWCSTQSMGICWVVRYRESPALLFSLVSAPFGHCASSGNSMKATCSQTDAWFPSLAPWVSGQHFSPSPLSADLAVCHSPSAKAEKVDILSSSGALPLVYEAMARWNTHVEGSRKSWSSSPMRLLSDPCPHSSAYDLLTKVHALMVKLWDYATAIAELGSSLVFASWTCAHLHFG